MRIVYDNIIFSLQRAGGISLYWSELIKRLGDSNFLFYEKKNSNIFCGNLEVMTQNETFLPLSVIRYLPFVKRLPKDSIFHSSYYRFSMQKGVLNVITVHDFTYEYYARGLQRFIHLLQKKIAIMMADGIICVSENTKRDLLLFYPSIDIENVRVIYNGVGEEFFPIAAPKLFLKGKLSILADKKYLIFVGDRSLYKNFGSTVDVLRQIDDIYLVIVGGKPFSYSEKKLFSSIADRIFFFNSVSTEILNILYNNAFCLVYPSSYEGFGIPIVEAMRAGCPVIAANKSSIPEVAGDSALLIDSIKPSSIIEKMTLLESQKFRKELILKGIIQSSKFNWDKCSRETDEFYKQTFNRKRKSPPM